MHLLQLLMRLPLVATDENFKSSGLQAALKTHVLVRGRWLPSCLCDKLTWLAGCGFVAGWLVGWLAGWLAGWSFSVQAFDCACLCCVS